MEKIEASNAKNPEDVIVLSDENSLFGSDVYISVTKEVENAETAKLSGTFFTKTFEGSYSNMGKWIKEMESYVQSKGKEIKKMLFYYTTCPKCAKTYGKNYTVILAQV